QDDHHNNNKGCTLKSNDLFTVTQIFGKNDQRKKLRLYRKANNIYFSTRKKSKMTATNKKRWGHILCFFHRNLILYVFPFFHDFVFRSNPLKTASVVVIMIVCHLYFNFFCGGSYLI